MTTKQVEFLKTLDPAPLHWGGMGSLPLHPDPRDYDIRSLPGVAEAAAALPVQLLAMP